MYSRIQVVIEHGPLKREIYVFMLIDGQEQDILLRLTDYRTETRASSRHKFRVEKRYSRMDPRASDFTAEEVPLPEEVREQAIAALLARLVVTR